MIGSGTSVDSVRSDMSRTRENLAAQRLAPANSGGFRSTLNNALQTMETRNVMNDQRRRLMDACVEMESLFVNRMLKEMRKTIQRSDWLYGGFAEDVFTDMLYDEYSLQLSRNSNLGIARQMYEEMSRNM